MARAGDVVSGRYHLLTRLGAGALGEVWAARDETTDREVAVKLLSPSDGPSTGGASPKWTIARKSLEAFFREAKASAKIRNPSVVELLDLGESKVGPPAEGGKAPEKKTPFVVMELLEGEKLEELLEQQGTLPVGTALRLGSELAWALVAAHEKGLIHERIEPANVILHRGGKGEIVPKLVDFGIARLVDDLDILPGTPHEALSPLPYLSPEQIHGDVELDGRADVYALGALLHRCLVGAAPFDGDDAEELLAAVEIGPKKLDEHEPPLDAKVVQLVADCLHRNRKLRPTMRVLAERLDVLRERFDAQWKSLASKVKVAPERTIERIASMKPPPRAAEKAGPPRPPPKQEAAIERLSASDLEEVPPPPARKLSSVPPPLPKHAPVSDIIREKLTQGGDGLDALADLENALLAQVAAQRAGEAPIALARVEDGDDVDVASVESSGEEKVTPAGATAKTLPPQRDKDRSERAKKSGAVVMFALAAAIAMVAFVVMRGEGSTAQGTSPQPSAAPTPSAVVTQAPPPAPTPSVVELAPVADPSVSATASAAASASAPAPAKASATASAIAPVATASATTAAPKPTSKPNGDPYYGVESAGF